MLSFVFCPAPLRLPRVAAGDDLAFFPLGLVFRREEAFFIRRKFAGDRLYAAVVDAYIRRVIREGYSIEFFLEGGRSRTGKLLPPKLGLLNMVVEAALAVPNKEVFFVPVSIGYERLVEGSAYVRELTGGEKQKENASGLLKTTRVLRGRYGRLNIQFGDILSLRGIRQNGKPPGPSEPPTPTPAKRAAPSREDLHRPRCRLRRGRREAHVARPDEEHHRALLRAAGARRHGALRARPPQKAAVCWNFPPPARYTPGASACALAPFQVRIHVPRRRDLRAEFCRDARGHARRRRARVERGWRHHGGPRPRRAQGRGGGRFLFVDRAHAPPELPRRGAR